MRALFDLFVDICLLRKGPQDLPTSAILLKLALGLYLLISLIQLLMFSQLVPALILALLDIALLIGLTYGVLQFFGHGARFVQTLSALAGVGVIIQVLALPIAFSLQREQLEQNATALPVLLWLGLLIWSIVIMGHILQQALSTSRAAGVSLALAYIFLSW